MTLANLDSHAVPTASCAPRPSQSRFALLSLLIPLSLVPFAVVVWQFYWPEANGVDITRHPVGRDFINVWIGPQLAFSGRLHTLFDLQGYHIAIGELFGHELAFHNWGYPLFTLLAYWPLSKLPYFWALAVWTVGLFAAVLFVALKQVPRSQRLLATFLLVLAPATLINTIGGQNGFLSAALFLGGILLLDRKPVVAGVLFGLLTFKPHLGIVLPFALLALGAWRTIASAVVTSIVIVLVSTLVFGVEAWKTYFEIVGAYQTQLLRQFQGFYTFMMTSVLAGARSLGVPYTWAVLSQAIVSVGVIAVACRLVRQTSDPRERALVLSLATLLATPYAFNYDMTALAAVAVWMVVGVMPGTTFRRDVLLLVWAAPLLGMTTAMALHAIIGVGLILTPLVLAVAFMETARVIAGRARTEAMGPSASHRHVAEA